MHIVPFDHRAPNRLGHLVCHDWGYLQTGSRQALMVFPALVLGIVPIPSLFPGHLLEMFPIQSVAPGH